MKTPNLRSALLLRAGPVSEFVYRGRFLVAPTVLVVQIALFYCLWRALYRNTPGAGDLSERQAVTYASLALLGGSLRESSRAFSNDAVYKRMKDGSIVYLFVRPLSPARYYMWRRLGEALYAAMWALAVYAAMVLTHLIDEPVEGTTLVFLVAFVLGQVLIYYMSMIVEVCCFWLLRGYSLVRMYGFIQDLLSGVFVPLWLLPAWLSGAGLATPFQLAIHFPVSVYIGKTREAGMWRDVGLQIVWCALLAFLSAALWRRAARRVIVHGG